MKAGEKKRKEPGNESTFNKQLLTYSLAAGSAFAMAQPAEAAIECHTTGPGEGMVYSGMDACVDLDGDTNYDVCFRFGSGTYKPDDVINWYYPYNVINLIAMTSAFAQRTTSDELLLARLQPGSEVGPYPVGGNSWASEGLANGTYFSGPGTDKSKWGPYEIGNFFDRQGCIGVKFFSEVTMAHHYGWIEYEGSGWTDDPVVAGRVVGWGYETEPNTPIRACTCEEMPTAPIPALNPLGLAILAGLILAGGAVAVRRRKSE